MRVNLKQEIALWVLGLFWGFVVWFVYPKDITFVLVLLVPLFLILFSLRDRTKSD